jgi:hypothetical protein
METKTAKINGGMDILYRLIPFAFIAVISLCFESELYVSRVAIRIDGGNI